MKKAKLIKLLSATQDNNVLVKKVSDTDYISQIILNAVNNNTDDKDNVDTDYVLTDLQYAVDQLKKAMYGIINNR